MVAEEWAIISSFTNGTSLCLFPRHCLYTWHPFQFSDFPLLLSGCASGWICAVHQVQRTFSTV